MAAGKLDLIIEQGATFRHHLDYLDQDENPIDLTGYDARMHIREHIEDDILLIDLSTINGRIALGAGHVGAIDIEIDATTTANIDWERAYYDLEIEKDTYVRRVIQGVIRVDKEVTR